MPSQGVTNVANAIINKINNLISSHNNNSNAHQDIREDILGDNYYVYELTSSNYTPALNDTITITCTMKDVYGAAASGKSITLYQNGTSKGTQTTNNNGVATWSVTCSTGGLQKFNIKDKNIEVFVNNILDDFTIKTFTQTLKGVDGGDGIYVYNTVVGDWEINLDLTNFNGNELTFQGLDHNFTIIEGSSNSIPCLVVKTYGAGTFYLNDSHVLYDDISSITISYTSSTKRIYINIYQDNTLIDDVDFNDRFNQFGTVQIQSDGILEGTVTSNLQVPIHYDSFNNKDKIDGDCILVYDMTFIDNNSDPSNHTFVNFTFGEYNGVVRYNNKIYLINEYKDHNNFNGFEDFIESYPVLTTDRQFTVKRYYLAQGAIITEWNDTISIIEQKYWHEGDRDRIYNTNGIDEDESSLVQLASKYIFSDVKSVKSTAKELQALIDNKGDEIYRIVGTDTSTLSNYARLNCGTFPFDSIVDGRTIVYVVPDISSLSESLNVDLRGTYPSSGITRAYSIKKSNDENLSIGEIQTGDELLLIWRGSNWRLIGNSSISDKENSSNKVSSWSSTTTDTHYPSEKLVKDSLDGKANSTHNHTKSQITDFPTIPSKTSDLQNDSGFLTSHQDISGKEDTSNKVSSWSNTPTDINYPSEKLVKDSLDSKIDTNLTYATATGNNDEILCRTDDGKIHRTQAILTNWIKNPIALTGTGGIGSASGDGQLSINTKINNALVNLTANKEDKIYRIVGTEVSSPTNNYSRLHCGTLPFDSSNGKLIVYVVPDISTLSESSQVLIYGSYPSGSTISTNIKKSNNEYLTIGEIRTGDELLLMVNDGSWRLIGNSSISDKEDKSNKVTSISSSSTDTQYPSAKAVYDLISLIYPIGSIYMSVNSTDPSTFLGGTWEQIKDRFLLGSGDTYANGSTGGSATVTLTASQSGVPAHNHTYAHTDTTYKANTTSRKPGTATAANYVTSITGTANNTTKTSSNNTAQNAAEAHNNMPPYLAVYMWERVG